MELQWQIPSFPILFTCFIFIFMLLKISNKPSNPPPGPFKFPLIGNIPQLSSGGPLPHRKFRDLAAIYGPVMTIQLGQVQSVVISSPETAKEVLKAQDVNFADRSLPLAGEILLYNRNDILFGSYGGQWRQMRKLCTLGLLSAKRVQSFESVRAREVSHLVEFLRSKAGSPVNLAKCLSELTNSIMLATVVGRKCENREALMTAIDKVSEALSSSTVGDVFPSFRFVDNVNGMKSRLQKLRFETDRILEDVINQHKLNLDTGSEADDLLDVLLDLQKNGELQVPLTNDNIKAVIVQMFGAGSETTTKVVEWGLAELMGHPTIMKKAQEEVRRVFDVYGKVEESRFQELKYLKLIVKETLRLHPPLFMIPRECREKTKVGGYDLLEKTQVLINAWAIGRDPKVWSEPEVFNPERFENCRIDYRGTDFELIPFGGGKRICPGMTFGMTNVELYLANLLYHFDWKFPDGITIENFDMTEAAAGTLKRKLDLELIPVPYPSGYL